LVLFFIFSSDPFLGGFPYKCELFSHNHTPGCFFCHLIRSKLSKKKTLEGLEFLWEKKKRLSCLFSFESKYCYFGFCVQKANRLYCHCITKVYIFFFGGGGQIKRIIKFQLINLFTQVMFCWKKID